MCIYYCDFGILKSHTHNTNFFRKNKKKIGNLKSQIYICKK